ncbi:MULTISPECIES: hypothetical protein [unclassified Mesorhizobium]|uniref:hypothetical protein n=1 Tax=unclassified Mesorhizobium TaxID=325217 RepID=UPI0003CF397D|nr:MULTISPECIES: hypothetical protein [unclassified Mesorhizobium]ESX59914.1 hypothetical protein X760_17110 [Mesorhizobium sp. LSHC422A00]
MRYGYSARLREDLNSRVLGALRSRGMVNIAVVAEDIRLRNLDENVALEDVERLVMQTAQLYGAVMELDGLTSVEAGRLTSLADDKHELPGIGNSDTTGGQPAPLLGLS